MSSSGDAFSSSSPWWPLSSSKKSIFIRHPNKLRKLKRVPLLNLYFMAFQSASSSFCAMDYHIICWMINVHNTMSMTLNIQLKNNEKRKLIQSWNGHSQWSTTLLAQLQPTFLSYQPLSCLPGSEETDIAQMLHDMSTNSIKQQNQCKFSTSFNSENIWVDSSNMYSFVQKVTFTNMLYITVFQHS